MAKNQVADGDTPIPDTSHFTGPVENDVEILSDVTEVDFILDEHEVAEKGTESAEIGEALAALKKERREILADLNERKTGLEGARGELVGEARAMTEEERARILKMRQVEIPGTEGEEGES